MEFIDIKKQLLEDKNNKNLFDYPLRIKKAQESEVFKELLTSICSKSDRCIHPAWFYIFEDKFKKEGVQYYFTNNILNLSFSKKYDIPHISQICESVRIYSSLISNIQLNICFLDETSEFLAVFPETKRFLKTFLFPKIECQEGARHIDLTYDFVDKLRISIEINEMHHKKYEDKLRANEIYVKTKRNLILHYLDESTIEDLEKQIINKFTKELFKYNEKIGLYFHLIYHKIIPNVSICMFFSSLKDECDKQELTWSRFKTKCNELQIPMCDNFLIELVNEDAIDFHTYFENVTNFTTLTSVSLLTHTGYDCLLMSTKLSDIKIMFSRYKQSYEKLIIDINKSLSEGEIMTRQYIEEKEIEYAFKDMLHYIAKCFFKSNRQFLNANFPFLKKANGSGRFPNKEKVKKFANECDCEINLGEYSGIETIRGYRWLNENDIIETFKKNDKEIPKLFLEDDDDNQEEYD